MLRDRRWLKEAWPIIAAAALPIIIMVIYLRDVPVSLLWDAESYFNTARRFSNKFPYLPALIFRAPGYPAFLKLFQTRNDFDLNAIISAQKLLFLFSTILVYWITRRITGWRLLGVIAALLFGLNLRILLHANSVMVETLAVFLELLVISFYVKFLITDKLQWLAVASITLAAAIFVRPTFIVAVPVMIVFIFISPTLKPNSFGLLLKRSLLRSSVVALLALLPVLCYSIYNYNKVGHFKAFQGAGFSSLNYVTNPCFFQRLSDGAAYIRDPLIAFQTAQFPEFNDLANIDRRCSAWFGGRPWGIHWGNTFDFLKTAYERRYGNKGLEWDSLAMRITLDAIRDRPLEYLRIWSQVFSEFWTAHTQLDGYYETVQDFVAHKTILQGRPGEAFFTDMEAVYAGMAVFSLPIVLSALILATIRSAPLVPAESRRAALFIASYCLCYSLLSTLLEAGAQSRYRIPLDPFIYVLFAFAVRSLIALGYLARTLPSFPRRRESRSRLGRGNELSCA